MRSLVNRIRNYSGDIRLYLLYTLLANVAIGVFALVFNLYLIELGQREDYIGIFNAIQTMAMAATAVSLGWFINRYGIWNVVFAGTVAYLVASILLVVVTQPAILLAMSALWGASTALVFTPVMPFLADLARPRQRQEVATITMSLVSLSTTIGSLVGGWSPFIFEVGLGFERPSAAAFRATMLVGIVIAGLGVQPLLKMTRERKEARPRKPSQVDESYHSEDSTPSTIRNRMFAYIAVGLVMSLGAGAVFPFYNVFLSEVGATSGQIGMVFAGAWTIAAVVGLASPYVSGKLGSQLGASLIRLLPIPLFLLLMPFPILPLAIVAHLVRVSSITMSWPIESSYISDVLPDTVRNSVFGYRSAAWNVGFSLSSFVGGALIVRYGYSINFALYAVAMVIAMGWYYLYFRQVTIAPYVEEEEPELAEFFAPESGPPETVIAADTSARLTLEPGRGRPIVILSEELPEEVPATPPSRQEPIQLDDEG